MTAKPHGRALTVADGGAAKLIRQRCSFAGAAEERLSQSVLQEETNLLFGWSSDAAETAKSSVTLGPICKFLFFLNLIGSDCPVCVKSE